ncbi:MAG: ABC transporter permease subunit [Chloroflexi bacterium]|nr:ABC transporter permease subunit [Chloroflexota bacterium]
MRRNTLLDNALSSLSILFFSIPDFWLAIMLMLVFAIQLRWLPISGTGTWQAGVLPRWRSSSLPCRFRCPLDAWRK